jgi:ParB family chromosome partitioning protein
MKEELTQIDIGVLDESKTNTRKTFDKAAMAELTASVKEKGILVPLLVRPDVNGGENERYEIVCGARRYRAAIALGFDLVPAIVRVLSDEDAWAIGVVDNLQRADISPIDEAEGYAALMKSRTLDAAAVAAKVGKSASYVYQRLKLVDLIPDGRKMLSEGTINVARALLVARLNEDEQDEVLDDLLYDPLSTADLSRHIQNRFMLDLSEAAWKKDDVTLVQGAGACKSCPKRSGFNKELFSDIQKKDMCSDAKCFEAKGAAFLERMLEKAGKDVVKISSEYSSKKYPGSSEYGNATKECAHPEAALVVEGKGTGKMLSICRDPKCKPCGRSGHPLNPSTSSASPKDRYERRVAIHENRIEMEVRKRTREAVLPLIKGPLNRWHLLALLRETMDATHNVDLEESAKLVGLKWPNHQRISAAGDIAHAEKILKKATDDDILRFIFAIATNRDMIQDPGFAVTPTELLEPLLYLHNMGSIDVKAIEGAVRAELAPKAPKPPKEEPKGKKK